MVASARAFRRPAEIQDDYAYDRAVRGRIEAAMRAKAARRAPEWLAEGDHQQLLERMQKQQWSDFVAAMLKAFETYGCLTDKQEEAVRGTLARIEARDAERKAERRAQDAGSRHQGTPGERAVFVLTVRKVFEQEGQYGLSFTHVMQDGGGNVLVYRGNVRLADEGEAVRVKATVKAHEMRDGIAQTVLARPKMTGTKAVPEEAVPDHG